MDPKTDYVKHITGSTHYTEGQDIDCINCDISAKGKFLAAPTFVLADKKTATCENNAIIRAQNKASIFIKPLSAKNVDIEVSDSATYKGRFLEKSEYIKASESARVLVQRSSTLKTKVLEASSAKLYAFRSSTLVINNLTADRIVLKVKGASTLIIKNITVNHLSIEVDQSATLRILGGSKIKMVKGFVHNHSTAVCRTEIDVLEVDVDKTSRWTHDPKNITPESLHGILEDDDLDFSYKSGLLVEEA